MSDLSPLATLTELHSLTLARCTDITDLSPLANLRKLERLHLQGLRRADLSGVGEVRLEAGQLVTMTFRDSYAVDDFTQPYPALPEPMQRFMGGNLMV